MLHANNIVILNAHEPTIELIIMLYLPFVARVATAINSGRLVAIPNSKVLPKVADSPNHASMHPLHELANINDDNVNNPIPAIKTSISKGMCSFINIDSPFFCLSGSLVVVGIPLPTTAAGLILPPTNINNTASAYDKKMKIENKLNPCQTTGLICSVGEVCEDIN